MKGESVEAQLHEACERQRSCILTAPAAGTSCSCLVWEVTSERAQLAFEVAGARDEFQPRSVCLLTFGVERGTAACLSRVIESHAEGVSLELPSRLVTVEGRLTFRVPLRGEHGLRVGVDLGEGAPLGSEPLNISLGGVLLDLEAPPGESSPVKLCLSLERSGLEATVPGIRRHAQASRVGFAFDLARDRDGESVVPKEVRAIVMDVQQHWLKTRVT